MDGMLSIGFWLFHSLTRVFWVRQRCSEWRGLNGHGDAG